MGTREINEELANPLDDMLGYQIHRAADATQEAVAEALARLDLRPIYSVVLHLIHANPGCNQSSIGRALGVQRTNLVPVMADLEGRGLIRRTPADGRSNALHLTREGTETLQEIVRITQELEDICYGAISPRMRSRMVQALRSARQRAVARA